MAYQNVGTPRFFIDNYIYLRALGLDPQEYINETADINRYPDPEQVFKTPLDNENAFTLSPDTSKLFPRDSYTQRWFIPCGEMIRGMDFTGNMKWYGAILNHNFADCNVTISRSLFAGAVHDESETETHLDANYEKILNLESYSEQQNGSSIWSSDNIPSGERFTGFRLAGTEDDSDLSNLQIGAVSMGVMYTMPNSADLNLTMKIEFDGYDETETASGSTLTNIRQTGASVWLNDGKYNSPFAVGEFFEDKMLSGAKRNGRRTWSLKFSYIADTDLFSSNYMNTNYNETIAGYNDADLNTENQFEYNMFTDDSFVAQVWNKTLGGALPFIFQPDSSNDNPDQFCIAKFDQDTLSIKQVAFRTYSFSIKIREVW